MSNVQEYGCLLRQYFHPQLIIPELAERIGLEENIVLQQIHYWLEKSGKIIDGEVWIYNTFDQWKQQFTYWSISKIKRIFYSLEKAGLIISKKINVHKSNHTKWYSLDYTKLSSLMDEILPKRNLKRKKLKEKKFDQIKNELSSSQFDTIINTNTNYTNNTICISNESDSSIEITLSAKQSLDNQTDKDFFIKLGKEEKAICEQMLKVWQQVFIDSKEEAILTSKRETKLYRIWTKFCNEDMNKWQEICLAVNSSKFLMGEKNSKFKAYFDWLISENTVSRILAGEFNIGDRIPDIKKAEMAIKAKHEQEARTAKLEAERAEKIQKEKQLDIERTADYLARKELKKIEADWSDLDKDKAMSEFKDFLSRGGDGESFFDHISEEFRKHEKLTFFQAEVIDFFFVQFKIMKYLEKGRDEFLKEAGAIVESGQFINYEGENNTEKHGLCEAESIIKTGNTATGQANDIRKKDLTQDLELELELVARKLAGEELLKIESGWTNADKERAINEFEDFLKRGGDGNPGFEYIIENFRKKGWIEQNTTTVNSYFQEFKLITYLKKTWDDFKRQAVLCH